MLIFPLVILVFTAISSVSPDFGTASIFNPGPHGLSEILYAYTSGAGEQRLGLRRPDGEHQVVQHDPRPGDALRPVLHDHPDAGARRQPGRKKRVPASPGTFPVTTPLFTALLVGVILIVGALTFFPALSLGPIVEHCPDAGGTGVLMATHPRSIWDPQIVRGAVADSLRKLHPRTMVRNPVMFVVEVGSVLTTLRLAVRRGHGAGRPRLRAADHALALADGALRQLRRSDGGGARQGAGRHAAAGQDRDDGQARAARHGTLETVPAPDLRKGDVVCVAAGEVIPADGEIIEGVASVDESGDHR